MKQFIMYPYFTAMLLLAIIVGTPVHSFAKYQYGSIIMSKYAKEMKNEKVDIVVFPHWIHTMWYKCKACHNDVFVMKAGVNDILMDDIDNGKKCGLCHNGTDSFSQKECKKCHSLSSDEVAMTLKMSPLYPGIYRKKFLKGKEKKNTQLIFDDPANVPFSEYKAIADRLKIEWNADVIEKNGLPLDSIGLILWSKVFFKDRSIIPKNAIKGEKEDDVRDNFILFEGLSDFVDNVAFPHREHSYLIDCNVCHEEIFKATLGGNMIHMRNFVDGEFCGRCHGKVSFPPAECTRCHKFERWKKNGIEGTVLKRKNPLEGKKLDIRKGSGLTIIDKDGTTKEK